MGIWAQLTQTWILPGGWYRYPDNQRDTTGGVLALAIGTERRAILPAIVTKTQPEWSPALDTSFQESLPIVTMPPHIDGTWACGSKYQKQCSSQDLPAVQLSQDLQDGLGSWGGRAYMGICYTIKERQSVGSSIAGISLPPPPPPSPNTHWGRISKDCGWGPRLVQQTFAWRQGKGMSNLPVKDPAKIGPSFLSRWVVNPLWLWGMFLLFQVCFSGHLNLAMNGAARNSGYRPT